MIVLKIVCSLSLLTLVSSQFQKTVIAKATGVKCQHDERFITNMTCKLRAVKGKNGVLTMKATQVKTLTDIQMHTKVYYKFGNAIFRSWMVDVTKDLCLVYKELKNGSLQKQNRPILVATLTYLNKVAPKLFHECPYRAGVETSVENFEIDELMANIVPSLVPNGDYRTLVRFHTSKNETIFQFLFSVTIKAIDKIKAYDMG